MMTGRRCNEPAAIGNGPGRVVDYAGSPFGVAAGCPVRLYPRLVREADSGPLGAAP